MKINFLSPDQQILQELGRRLARVRKQQAFTQDGLAAEAGLGVATLRRIENGQDSQLGSWLKLLKTLNMTASIEALLPENYTSPMAEARAKRRHRRQNPADSPGPVVWGDGNS